MWKQYLHIYRIDYKICSMAQATELRSGLHTPTTLFDEAKQIMSELIGIQEQVLKENRIMNGLDYRKDILAPLVLSLEFALPIINEEDCKFGSELKRFVAYVTNDQVKSKWRFRTNKENAFTQRYTLGVMKAIVQTY